MVEWGAILASKFIDMGSNGPFWDPFWTPIWRVWSHGNRVARGPIFKGLNRYYMGYKGSHMSMGG